MAHQQRRPLVRTVLLLLAALLLARCSAAAQIPLAFCSTLNTAETPSNRSDFQSQGLCRDFCNAKKYGLAIVQGNYCWCSSTEPTVSLQVSTSQCQNACPGYPSDVCGGDDTFGYMQLDGAITSTATSLGTAKSTTKATPVVETVTADGVVTTVTRNPSAATGLTDGQSGGGGGGSSLSAGAAAGIAVGVVGILVIGGIFGFFALRRRRRRRAGDMFEGGSPRGSASGMAQVPPGSAAAGSSRLGRRGTDGNWESDNSTGRRSSMLMPSDPRMNPAGGIYARPENKSHDSFLSMQDNQDYSRPVHEPKKVLRVTNADPEEAGGS